MQEFFYRLISLPLFIGLTRDDALDMAGRARFDFRRYSRGEVITSENQICNELHFVIQGELVATERAIDGSFTLEEYLSAPYVVQPESLFGRSNRYTRTIVAQSDEVQILTVCKSDVRDILFTYTPFHLNYLNLLCTRQQNLKQRLWLQKSDELSGIFTEFLLRRCEYPAGHKRLVSGMNELADHLHTTRLNVSRMLHELESNGLISMQRGMIDIPSLDRLIKH